MNEIVIPSTQWVKKHFYYQYPSALHYLVWHKNKPVTSLSPSVAVLFTHL